MESLRFVKDKDVWIETAQKLAEAISKFKTQEMEITFARMIEIASHPAVIIDEGLSQDKGSPS